MTTSCCAGYNELRKKHLTEINSYVSDTKTPMYYTAEFIKEKHPNAKLVFLSPCVAKRKEVFENPNVDYLMNYLELCALFEGRKIKVEDCEETVFDSESSKQGRNFGVIGGVANAVNSLLSDENKANVCIINCLNNDTIKQLKKYAKEGCCAEGNLIEVMCYEGGCIGGNATIEKQRLAKKSLQTLLDKSNDLN